jgi:hypothetical protein
MDVLVRQYASHQASPTDLAEVMRIAPNASRILCSVGNGLAIVHKLPFDGGNRVAIPGAVHLCIVH